MNFFVKLTGVCAVVGVLAACSGGSSAGSTDASSTPAPQASAPSSSASAPTRQVSGPVIDNEDMTPGLKGVDANRNGIRDDIDRLIATRYAMTPAMKKAVEQKARALQLAMEATSKPQARVAGNELMRAARCSYKSFPTSTDNDEKFIAKMSKEVEALTANTAERFKAYWNGERLAGGMVFQQPEEPVCD
jgi:hypothetical protein